MIKKSNRSLKKSGIINTHPVSVTTGISVFRNAHHPPKCKVSTFCDSLYLNLLGVAAFT